MSEETGASDTGFNPEELAATIVDLGPANFDAKPQLAYADGELGVSWDVHQRFVRLDPQGMEVGLTETIIDYDAKDPDLGVIEGDFIAVFANYNSEVLLRRREATDTWTSLGRQDAAAESVGPTIAIENSDIFLAWREDVLNFRVALSNGAGTPGESDLRELGSSHLPQRILLTPDAVFTLIKQDLGEHSLLRHDRQLGFEQSASLNDGPADAAWNPGAAAFTFVAFRDGQLVEGTFDGTAIVGELRSLDPEPGAGREVRVVGEDGRYLVAWRAELDDGTTPLTLGRLVESEPFETLSLDEDAGRLTDLVVDGPQAAVGWAGPGGPRVALVTW